ncbi:hypothetical protein HYU09_03265 [Candidatus Woesearchaeota archaeon]|nr:hypothetical protein [Candidatus Woesearchaeota archaeon]
MNRKAQGLSINTIIIAAIALIVLVVLIAIFTGRLGLFSKGLGEATTCSQICEARNMDVDPNNAAANLVRGALDSNGNQCYCKPKG